MKTTLINIAILSLCGCASPQRPATESTAAILDPANRLQAISLGAIQPTEEERQEGIIQRKQILSVVMGYVQGETTVAKYEEDKKAGRWAVGASESKHQQDVGANREPIGRPRYTVIETIVSLSGPVATLRFEGEGTPEECKLVDRAYHKAR